VAGINFKDNQQTFCIFRKIFYFCIRKCAESKFLGDKVPYFIENMIEKQDILDIVSSAAAEKGLFIVDVIATPAKKITVVIDNFAGAGIDDCVFISRKIEASLGDRIADFDVEVSTPGLDKPFKVEQQYLKSIGKDVEICLSNGEKHKGKLLKYSGESIEVEVERMVKREGKKKKEKVTEKINFNLDKIKTTRLIITFK